jgi:hypothetical protein
MAFQNQPLHHMGDNIASKTVVRAFLKHHIGPDSAGKIFIRDRVHPVGYALLQSFTGFDLVTRDANFHLSYSFQNVDLGGNIPPYVPSSQIA